MYLCIWNIVHTIFIVPASTSLFFSRSDAKPENNFYAALHHITSMYAHRKRVKESGKPSRRRFFIFFVCITHLFCRFSLFTSCLLSFFFCIFFPFILPFFGFFLLFFFCRRRFVFVCYQLLVVIYVLYIYFSSFFCVYTLFYVTLYVTIEVVVRTFLLCFANLCHFIALCCCCCCCCYCNPPYTYFNYSIL